MTLTAPFACGGARSRCLHAAAVLVGLGGIAMSSFSMAGPADDSMNDYSVTWDSPGRDYHDSMPIGNGDIGLNLWTEQNGDIVFLIGKTDAWTENGQLVKLGRVRVSLDPSPFAHSGAFHQILRPKTGEIEIDGDNGTVLRVWVDANAPVIHLEANGNTPMSLKAGVELWRLQARTVDPNSNESKKGFRELHGSPDPLIIDPDTILPAQDNALAWCHFNTRSIYPSTFLNQHLESLLPKYPDPLLHRCFGVMMEGPGLVSADNQTLQTASPQTSFRVDLFALTQQADSPEQWRDALGKQAAPIEASDLETARQAHQKWWSDFWNRSWIKITGDADGEKVTQGYAMQRWMEACGGRGANEMKYNGSIFTVGQEPGPDADPSKDQIDPDYRAWGSNYWFQNNRHLNWPLIAAGDHDVLMPFIKMYQDSLPLALDRTQAYFSHGGAVWPETMFFWGLPNNNDFGWGNSSDIMTNRWIRYHVNSSLELVALMLDEQLYTQDSDFARSSLLPIADAVTTYFDQHWKRGADGKLLLDPDQALETYQYTSPGEVVNPTPDVAGLHWILPRLLSLPPELVSDTQRAMWTKLLADLPPIPTGTTGADGKIPVPSTSADASGTPVIWPAQKYGPTGNVENPELYAVFPYRIYGLGKPDLELAQNTYHARRFADPIHDETCWTQNGLDAALLGLTDDARQNVVSNFTAYGNQRFSWFWRPGHDWIPDMDNGGAGMETLQLMLMQCDGKKIVLLPTWPAGWNADFKLHAPYQTTLQGEVRDGKITNLQVSPEDRKADVSIGPPAPGA